MADILYRVHLDARIMGRLIDGFTDIVADTPDAAFQQAVALLQSSTTTGFSTAQWRLNKVEELYPIPPKEKTP